MGLRPAGTLTRISGGSIDTDVNAFDRQPPWTLAVSNVTTTTPVAKRPRQIRSDGDGIASAAVMPRPGLRR